MPQTIDKTSKGQIIGGIFSDRANADKAVKAFQKLNISIKDQWRPIFGSMMACKSLF
jgi:hypothetical protein